MEQQEVKDKLKTGELKRQTRTAGKSEVWKSFKLIVKNDTEASVGFAECGQCGALLSYESKKTGTSTLSRHLNNCTRKIDDHQTSILSFIPKTAPLRAKQAITDKCVDFCCQDLRPFSVVSGEGFKSLAQELINIGSTFGNFLIERVKKALAGGCDVAMSTDMWTDDYRRMSYIAITCHFTETDFRLVGKTLTTAVFPVEDAKTGKNIRRELVRLLVNRFGLEPSSLSRIVWVTDQGSNIVKALEPYKRLSCLDHVINTVLRHGLDKDALSADAPDIGETITAAKSVVRFIKQSGLAAQLSKTVLQMGETRFSTVHLTLKSVREIYNELYEKLQSRAEEVRMDNIAPDLLDFLISFLEPFYAAQRELEGDKYTTLNLVCLWNEKLKKHCQPISTDNPQQAFLLKIHMLHKVALFLWPNFNKLKMMTPTEVSEVHAHVRTLLEEEDEGGEATATTLENEEDEAHTSTLSPPAAKRKRTSFFGEWENEDDDDDVPVQDEVNLYISQKHAMADDRDLLGWWRINSSIYPKLAKLARSVLCIPASSSSSERVFSAAGRTIDQRRTSLKPGTVDLAYLYIMLDYSLQQVCSYVSGIFFILKACS
uniref:BED-type domain-containing protein n=1 Tax=Takifugu rubripes TaxID=31033 RepID=A0A674NDC5_TAKRU